MAPRQAAQEEASRPAPRPEPVKIEKALHDRRDDHRASDLTERIGKPAGEIIKKLMMLGIIATINHEVGLRHRTAGLQRIRRRAGNEDGKDRRGRRLGKRDARTTRRGSPAPPAGGHHHGPRRPRQDLAAGRHPADAASPRAKRAASPSTSAPTRWRSNGQRDHLPRHPRPRGVHRHACPRRAGRPTSPSWSWRPTTASCRRPSRPSTTPRPPACRSSWPSTRSTSRTANPERVKQELTEYEPGARGVGRRHDHACPFPPSPGRASTRCWK